VGRSGGVCPADPGCLHQVARLGSRD